MKKNTKLVLITILVIALSASMILGLSGCSKVNVDSFAKAQTEWEAAQDKIAVDHLSLEIALPIKAATDLKISVTGKITREYKNGEINKVSGVLSSIKVVGVDKLLNGVVSGLGSFIDGLGDLIAPINDLVTGGVLEIRDLAEGSIRTVNGQYVLEGDLFLGTGLNGAFGLTDIETIDPAVVDKDLVDSIISMFTEDQINFDMISPYNINSATMSVVNKNTLEASFNPTQALSLFTNLLFGKINAFMLGDLDDDILDVAESLNAENPSEIASTLGTVRDYIVQVLSGIFEDDDIQEIFNSLVSLDDNVKARIEFNKDKISKLEFQHNATVDFKSVYVNRAFKVIKDIIEDNGGEFPKEITNNMINAINGLILFGSNNALNVTATISVTTTLSY